MAVFVAYFDGSGDPGDPNCQTVTVGGRVSTEKRWVKFEREWQQALKDEGVSMFHMKDFAHSRGEFARWKGDEARRTRFIQRLTRIIKSRTQRGFAVSLFLRHYEAVNRQYHFEELVGRPYTVAAFMALTALEMVLNASHPNHHGILYVFEKGDTDQDDFRRFLPKKKFAVDPIFMEKKPGVGVPLQAADFVAYEHAKACNDYLKTGKVQVRKSAFGVMPRQRDRAYRFMDTAMLMMMIRDMKIPKRKA